MDWLISRGEASSRQEAVDLGKQLLEAGVFRHGEGRNGEGRRGEGEERRGGGGRWMGNVRRVFRGRGMEEEQKVCIVVVRGMRRKS